MTKLEKQSATSINIHKDVRGAHSKFFMTADDRPTADTYPIREIFMTTNHKHVMRGMHFQLVKPQAKILTCITGSARVCVISLNKNDELYLKPQMYNLNAEDKENAQVNVPGDHALGYLILEDNTRMMYFADEDFYPGGDGGFSPLSANIPWIENGDDLPEDLILSDKDKDLPTLKEYLEGAQS